MSSTTLITGREPRLSMDSARQGKRRLSLRHLATMLNVLPPDAISLDAAVEMLRNEEFFVRYNAAKMLSRRGDREARLVMQQVLTNGNVPSRATVARHLHGFSWYTAEPLIHQALQDSDPRVREGAIYALCDLREWNAFQLLVQVLKNEVDSVREAAAWGLRDCQDSAAVAVLAVVLEASDPDTRVKALEALGTNDTPEAVTVVRQAMTDAQPQVAYAATLSFLELTEDSHLDELADVICSTHGETRRQILQAFFHATNYLKVDLVHSTAADKLIDAFENALQDDVTAAREAAIWPLAWVRHQRAPAILKRYYEVERDSVLKAQMVRVTVSLMSEDPASESARMAEEILQDALNNADALVRQTALEIVGTRKKI